MPGLNWKPAFADAIGPLLRRPFEADDGDQPGVPHACDAVIASYNVHKCVGIDGAFDPMRTIRVIRELEADVVALQEVDQRFGDRNGLMDLALIADSCDLVPIPLTPTRKGHGWHGNLVLCRPGAVISARQMALPGGEPRGALIVDLEMPTGPLRIVAAHLGLLRRSRTRQVEAILREIADDHNVPTLMMGDLNEWRLGARSSLKGLEAAFPAPAPLTPSFPARFPVLALDRFLANEDWIVAHAQAHETPLARMASDHLPIKAWVNLSARSASRHRQGFAIAA